MKIYVVHGISDMEVNPGNFVEVTYFYGVFSSQVKADEIANNLRGNIAKNKSREEIIVEELTLDEPTEWYCLELSN